MVCRERPRHLAKELGPKNIRVNTIAPDMTESEGSTVDGRPGSAM